jgi:hypothetical protein
MGTGAMKLNDENQIVRVGGVRWTIKDGIIYDAPQLLNDVAEMVKAQKVSLGILTPEIIVEPNTTSESSNRSDDGGQLK